MFLEMDRELDFVGYAAIEYHGSPQLISLFNGPGCLTIEQLGALHVSDGVKAMESYTPVDHIAFHAAGEWGELGRYEGTEVTPEEMEGGPFATSEDAKLNKIAVDGGNYRRVMSVWKGWYGEVWVDTVINENTQVYLASEY